jgi:hypothetical protein
VDVGDAVDFGASDNREKEVGLLGWIGLGEGGKNRLCRGAALFGAPVLKFVFVLLTDLGILPQFWRQLRPGSILEPETPKQDE